MNVWGSFTIREGSKPRSRTLKIRIKQGGERKGKVRKNLGSEREGHDKLKIISLEPGPLRDGFVGGEGKKESGVEEGKGFQWEKESRGRPEGRGVYG